MQSLGRLSWERKAEVIFVPYLPGDPDWNTSLDIVRSLIDSGADSIEFGLPSDPIPFNGLKCEAALQLGSVLSFTLSSRISEMQFPIGL